MLTFSIGKSSKYCDGVSRRSFLQLGTLGIGGLTLADVFRAEAASGGSTPKSVINIHLAGGPAHQDMFDLKPEAPVEFRGEFHPIASKVPGLRVCQLLPQLALVADKFSVIRSLVGSVSDHSNFPTQTGYNRSSLRGVGGRPSIGAVVSRLQGPSASGAPPWIAYNGGFPGYLGAVFQPYHPDGKNLRLIKGVSGDRLRTRNSLLASLDSIRREVDASGQMEALDAFTQQAVGVVTSGRVADALDLDKENPKVRERYGNSGKGFLRARRLVEAGVRVVTLNWGGWDTHSNNFGHLRGQLPNLDVALSALVRDLYERGLDQDVTLVMWGEFGRSPRVNKNAGRDHWETLSMAFLSGGGMHVGQSIGASDSRAAYVVERPVHLQEVFATLYHNLGIDPARTTIIDPAGRPQYLVDHREPIKELIGT